MARWPEARCECSRVRERSFSLGLIVAVFVSLSGLPAASGDPPPVEAFGMRPFIDNVTLSPAGTHYAALQWDQGRQYLAVYDLGDTSDQRVKFLELDVSKRIVEKVDTIHWLNDETVGVVFQFESERWGVPSLETRLVAVKRDLSESHTIPTLPADAERQGQLQHRILDYLPDDPDHVLMAIDLRGFGTELDVCRVHIKTGRITIVMRGGETVAGYGVDGEGRVRLRYEIQDKKQRIRIRNLETKRWDVFQEAGPEGSFELLPQVFTKDGNKLLVSRSNDAGFDEIFEFDLTSWKLGKRIAIPPIADLLGVATDPYTRAVLGINHATHYPTVHYIDEELAKIQERVDEVLPHTQNSIRGFDRSRDQFVVFATGPKNPGAFYFYRKQKDRLSSIGKKYATRLEAKQLCDVEPISYEARDGLTIPAYLTRPEGTGPIPMVVLPHGGPTARDYLGFDPYAQFLASRGYAVLQPNFRGSSGYGAEFEKAGYGEWGLAMQDDLTDGVKAAIERGIADPERICIVGWSYGGYAALMGAVVTPELYRCAVSGAGVTDIRRMLTENARYRFTLKNPPSVGHYRRDRDKLRDTSPINNVDAIRVPVLLVHGSNDLSVPVAHSKKMASALKKLGKPHKLVILKDGDHQLSLERNRVRFLKELEVFLAEHIGGAN